MKSIIKSNVQTYLTTLKEQIKMEKQKVGLGEENNNNEEII